MSFWLIITNPSPSCVIKKEVTSYPQRLQVCKNSEACVILIFWKLYFALASGLDPILFAISIDREDLNNKFYGIIETINNEQIVFTSPIGKLQLFILSSTTGQYLRMSYLNFCRRNESK